MSQNDDLISREALLKEVRENKELYEKERVYLEGLLLNAPTVERPQGEWILDSVGVYCSECKTHPDYSSNFCPNCGAKMKGGAE